MKNRKFGLGIILSATFFFILFESSAFAEDFTFYVPVELTRIHPDLKNWSITVKILTYDIDPLTGNREEIGAGTKHFTVQENYSNTFEIKFNSYSQKKPEDGRKFVYFLQVKDPQTGKYVDPEKMMRPDGPYPRDTSKWCQTRGEGYLAEYQ